MQISTDIEHDPTHLTAADWFVRLQSTEVSLEDTVAWQSWLAANPANARAFAHIEEISQVVGGLPSPPMASSRALARDRYDASVPLKEWRKPYAFPRVSTVFAIAASIGAAALALAFWKTGSPDLLTTTIGENRTVSLSDGSTIALGGDTRIEVSLSKTSRVFELTKGEALFTAAKDARRPFKVHAGDVTIVALGTAFNVQRGSDRAIVSVTEGRVLVEPVGHLLPASILREFKPKLRAVHLDAGQQTSAGSAGIEAPTTVEDPTAATAWRSGRLAFRLQPLRYVLEDVNRYARKPIVLEGRDVGSLIITGTVSPDNIKGWIDSLQRAFDLQAIEEPERIVIRAR